MFFALVVLFPPSFPNLHRFLSFFSTHNGGPTISPASWSISCPGGFLNRRWKNIVPITFNYLHAVFPSKKQQRHCCPSKPPTGLVPRPSLFVICRPALVESFVSTGRRCSIYHRFMLTGAFLDRRDSAAGALGVLVGRGSLRSFVGLCGLIRLVLLSRYFSPPPAS